MPHVFFFSYAHKDKDLQLEKFFEDLCEEVAVHTPWPGDDPRVSFRDASNLPLMKEWRPELLSALQSSAVLVCLTSPRYFTSRFCGQEYYLFDQRRRFGISSQDRPPAVILPIVWVPIQPSLPPAMAKVQWQEGTMPELYAAKGLRYLRKLAPDDYARSVVAFAEAIRDAWQSFPAIPPLGDVAPFENVPNMFGGGLEAAEGVHGWLPGPGVANFVYAAGRRDEIPMPPGRYGATSSEWRPYLPPVSSTVAELARSVSEKQSLRYREIPVDENLADELEAARSRKNLTLVVADPQTLPMASYRPVTVFDRDTWEGTAVLMPWDGRLRQWDPTLQQVVSEAFPVRSQASTPPFQVPIATANEFEKLLDVTLTDLRAAVTRVEGEKKEKSDNPPTQVVGPSGATSGATS